MGHTATWQSSDLYPAYYTLLLNGSIVQQGAWNGSSLTFDIDGLNLGTYNLTLVTYDTSGNRASDTVLVRVVPPESSVPLVLSLSIAVILCIALVALVLHLERTGT